MAVNHVMGSRWRGARTHTRAVVQWMDFCCLFQVVFFEIRSVQSSFFVVVAVIIISFSYVKMGERETDEGRCLACSAVQKRTQSTPWTFALLLFCFKIRIDFSPLFWKQQPKQKQQNADWILEVFTKLAGKFSRAIIKNEERGDSRPTDRPVVSRSVATSGTGASQAEIQ